MKYLLGTILSVSVFWHTLLKYLIVLTILISAASNVFGQNIKDADSVTIVVHSPKKATYLALIPGAGQIYNKKYWKLPIVYAGFGVIGYFALTNRTEYIKYNDAYVCLLNDPEGCENELALKYDADQLKSARDYYRRNMELSFILLAAWYGLQILDAVVDAHLYNWEVNDNLSVRVEPTIQRLPIQASLFVPGNNLSHNGLKITVNF